MALRFDRIEITGTSTSESTPSITNSSNELIRFQTTSGYVDIGANNTGYTHFYTDRNKFYFNKKLIVDEGMISAYNEDLTLAVNDGANTAITIDKDSPYNVGIGVTSPSQKLEVAGNGLFGNGNTPITLQVGEATSYTSQTNSTLKLAQGGGNYHEFRGLRTSDEEGSIYRMQEYTDGQLVRMTQTYDGETTHILYGDNLSLSSNVIITGDLTVNGGDITLGGTGRIQGVDTVSASTDAVNKAYVDSNAAPYVTFYRAGINSSTYTMIATVNGDNLASIIKMTMTGTSGNVVFACTFDITVNHSQDIHVKSMNGDYTEVTLRITSNNNEDYSIEAKHNGSTTTTAEVCIFPLANEVITPTTTDPGYTGAEYEHTATEGWHYGGEDGNVESSNVVFDGKVGIGTTSPGKLLELKGGDNEAVLRLYNDQANTWDIQNSTLGKLDFIRGGSNTYMRIDQFGHVGIGVTSHSFLLDIGDSRNDNDVFRVNGSNADVLFSGNVTAPTGGVGLWNFINTGTNATTRFYVQDANNANDRLTFRFTGNGGSNEILSGTSSGNVGIGTTTISGVTNAKLYVNGGIHLPSNRDISGAGGLAPHIGTGDFILYSGNPGSGSEKFRITNGGNVGIKKTSPSERLHVDGKIYIESQGVNWNETTQGTSRGALHFDPVGDGANNTGNAITFGASDTGAGATAQAGIYTRSDGAYGTKMYFATTDSYAVGSKTRMMINHNGSVGIGTTSPGVKLDVNGRFRVQDNGDVVLDVNTNGAFQIGDTAEVGGGAYITGNNTDIDIIADGGPIVTFKSGGDVGINQTNPTVKLDVVDASASRTWSHYFATVAAFERNGDSIVNIVSGNTGNASLWFGRSNSMVRGRIRYEQGNDKMEFWTANAERAIIDSNGNLHVDQDIVAYSSSVTPSDIRLKDNINTIDSALDKVKKLRGVEYTWNAGSRKDKKDLGVIAQEVEEVLPDIVREHKMDFIDEQVYKTVDYEKITAVLIEAIKEQQKQIDELKNQLDAFTK